MKTLETSETEAFVANVLCTTGTGCLFLSSLVGLDGANTFGTLERGRLVETSEPARQALFLGSQSPHVIKRQFP